MTKSDRPSMDHPFISVSHLGKSFPSSRWPWVKSRTTALSDVSLCVHQGDRVVLLGLNGAGKTTLLKILATAIVPDAGTVTINGHALGRRDHLARAFIGFVANEGRSFYWRLTGRQNLEFFAALYGLPAPAIPSRIEALLRSFRVDYADKRFDSYSTGMKRKFALLKGLLHDPSLLLLDEPTKSLDRCSSTEFREYIQNRLEPQRTVLIATHDLDEAQRLGEKFIVLHKGRLLVQGALDELRQQTGSKAASLAEIYQKWIDHAQ